MYWYAIHTKPRQESVAKSNLERGGVTTFFPRLRRKKMIRRKYQWVTGPLFPRYLFAEFDFTENGRLVRYANGVANIVSFGGKPAVVEKSIIETIRSHCENEVVTLQPPTMKPGDTVEILEGPLRGLRGIFQREMSGSERVVILLESLGTTMHAQVSRSQLEKV